MNSNAFNYFALLAAIVVGYGVFISSDDSDEANPNIAGIMQGYYLRDAVITETTAEGAPHFRVAASEVAQNLQDKIVALNSLRVDYLKPAEEQSKKDASPAHWVLNADRGTAFENFRKLALQGNVQAHNLGAPRAIVFDTHSVDIDMDKETLKTRDAVQIGIDASRVNGRGFFADLSNERFALESKVGMRLAQAERSTKSSDISLPDVFEADTFEYRDNVWTLIKVRSKTPPFVQADTLRATGADIANNKIAMRGSVRVELPEQGQITSDTALVSIRNNQVSNAHVASDSPSKLVEFEHKRKGSEQLVKGRASTIDYDVAQSALKLENNVWFSDENGVWEMEKLDYNIATGAWSGSKFKGTLNRRPKSTGATPPKVESP